MTRVLFLALAALLSPAAVQASCTSISSTALAFGSYAGAGIAQSSAVVSLGGCTNGTVYNIGLNAGVGAGGTVTARKMTNGTVTLDYQMFQDSAHTANWGNTRGVDARTGTTSTATQPLTIYAQLPGAQYPTPGTYTDTATAAVLGGSGTTAFTVTATVAANCTFSATTLAFPPYNPAVAVFSTSTLTVTCTNSTPYTVGIGYGVRNQPQNRYVTNGSGIYIQYLLFKDAALSQPWGVPFYGTGFSGTGTGAAQNLTVYGEIYAGQFGTPGFYSDTVIATVTY
jgi:spore coat protein U-like protein